LSDSLVGKRADERSFTWNSNCVCNSGVILEAAAFASVWCGSDVCRSAVRLATGDTRTSSTGHRWTGRTFGTSTTFETRVCYTNTVYPELYSAVFRDIVEIFSPYGRPPWGYRSPHRICGQRLRFGR